MAVRAFLFDLDGVLVETTSIIRRGWEIFAAGRGIRIPEADYARFIYGRRTLEILVDYFKLSSSDARDLISHGLDDKTELVAKEGGLAEVPGAAAFVRASKTVGLRLAVASSASAANVRLAVRHLDLQDQFDATVSSADVTAGKPAPDPYLEAARRLDVRPSDAVVFEDTLYGIASARAAGARCVGVATTLARSELESRPGGADLVIDDFVGLEPSAVIRALGA